MGQSSDKRGQCHPSTEDLVMSIHIIYDRVYEQKTFGHPDT